MGRGRVGFLVPMTVFLVVASATAALAHFVYDEGYVWESGAGKCVEAYSEISDGTNDGGYSLVKANTWREAKHPWGQVDCFLGWPRPVSYLSVQNALYKWSGSYWYECRRTSLLYNDKKTSRLTQDRYWSRPCGDGLYGNWGGAWTNFDGRWVGGWMWSGHHLLPD